MAYPYNGSQNFEQKRLAILSKYYNDNTFLMLKSVLKPGQKVLEFGSGSGQIGALIADEIGEKGHYVAVEIHPDRINEAKCCFGKRDNITLIEKDVRDAVKELPESGFDVVYCRWFLWTLPEEARIDLLQVILTLLKPGGKLVAEETNMRTLRVEPEHPAVIRYVELTELRSKKNEHPMQLALELKALVDKFVPKLKHSLVKAYQPIISDTEDKKLLYYTVISSSKALKNIDVTEARLATLQEGLMKVAQGMTYRIFGVTSIINAFTKVSDD